MAYHFETLGEERFQQLAQALIVASFPNAQCLPVSQPDGGRDAFSFENRKGKKTELIIFQVKYTRDPRSKSEREALTELVKTELPKVNVLKKRGATSYYLISNVSGTSHLDAGSIDKTNNILTSKFDIPSFCWWRDDLEARINNLADVKWSFPDILKGTDVLQMLVEGSWKDHAESRRQALRSYIASQHIDDQEVKFKQVELQNKLLNLFVDLPARPLGPVHYGERYWTHVSHSIVESEVLDFKDMLIDEKRELYHRRRTFNTEHPEAATMLLTRKSRGSLNKVVLEGAPGQGKSTITQYICQVNRIKLLSEISEMDMLPDKHQSAPIRVPFRVDLRDYAAWLSGKNPFVAENQSAVVHSTSLESFIAAQVSHLSGGQDFASADLIAIAKEGHILIVLDGFDEVADIPTRRKVVEEITRAAARIQAHERSAQIIVTSRPAAFANSPGFQHEDWVHLELQSMTQKQIETYSKKWMEARHLPSKERLEFRSLLNEKLEQPHMRDLARNPMQLTILLALIHTRGLSLPDKRTSLYDNYMELFFNRESEKSRVVREHRDLLIDIHRYLAWTLHVAAEGGQSGGSITELDLKKLLRSYLDAEGHRISLVEDLFTGMVERVVALVSRVQGTFEFEVQPLREYFAARHLYETAPYSPPGSERSGTKPERFDALSRNFYWLNVLRFFCGCFSRGELASLVDGLCVLSRSSDYGLVDHPRTIAVMLLGDWVFSQQPLSVKRVVSQMFEQPGLKIFLSGAGRRATAAVVLPDRCGRSDLVEHAQDELLGTTYEEDRGSLFKLINDNSNMQERVLWWKGREPKNTSEIDAWFSDGRKLSIFKELSKLENQKLFRKYGDNLVVELLNSRRFDILYSENDMFNRSVELISDGHRDVRNFGPVKKNQTNIEKFSFFMSAIVYRLTLSGDPSISMKESLQRHLPFYESPTPKIISKITSRCGAQVDALISMLDEQMELDVSFWSSSLEPWETLINRCVECFGSRWAFKRLAVLASGMRAPLEKGGWMEGAWSGSQDICQAMRFARLRSGNVKWWGDQLALSMTRDERMLVALVLSTWATPKTLLAMERAVSCLLDALSLDDWEEIYRSCNEIRGFPETGQRSITDSEALPSKMASPRLCLVLTLRGGEKNAINIYRSRLLEYEGPEPSILRFASEMSVKLAFEGNMEWNEALEATKVAFDKGVALHHFGEENLEIPAAVAAEICRDAQRYPQSLVRMGQTKQAAIVGASAPKVGDIAARDNWFTTS